MDVTGHLIQQLREDVERIKHVVACLEELEQSSSVLALEYYAELLPPLRHRAGRRGMSTEERQEVSARMKRYWAGRRQEEKPAQKKERAWPIGIGRPAIRGLPRDFRDFS